MFTKDPSTRNASADSTPDVCNDSSANANEFQVICAASSSTVRGATVQLTRKGDARSRSKRDRACPERVTTRRGMD